MGHVFASDLHNFRFRMIAVRSQAHKIISEKLGNFRLRDDALNEGTAVSSHHSSEFNEDVFALTLRSSQRLGEFCMPLHGAAIIEMRMCGCF